MSEPIVGAARAKVNKKITSRLRGIPRGMICRSSDVKYEMGVGHITWTIWRDGGLDARVLAGTKTEYVSTDSLHDLFERSPKYVKRTP